MYTITSTWTELLGQYFPVFTKPGAKIFANLITGWVLCTARRTITGILPFADPTHMRAHDSYHRFFPDARWAMSRLWQRLALTLTARFCPNGVMTLALDDTLFHHSGQKMEGAGSWRDAVRSTKKKVAYAWGLNLVVLTLQIQPPWGGEPLGLPINMRLHRKKQKTLIELAVEMIQEVRDWLDQRPFRVVGDGFYATLAGKPLPDVTIVSRIRRDATFMICCPKRKDANAEVVLGPRAGSWPNSKRWLLILRTGQQWSIVSEAPWLNGWSIRVMFFGRRLRKSRFSW